MAADTDRLRTAAEVMTSCALYAPPDGGDLDSPADQWVIHCTDCAQNEATADLLRAVAEAAAMRPESDAVWWGVADTGIWSAALALADVILGG